MLPGASVINSQKPRKVLTSRAVRNPTSASRNKPVVAASARPWPVASQRVPREQRRRCADNRDDQQEEAAETIHAERRAHAPVKAGAHGVPGSEHPHPGGTETHGAEGLHGEPRPRRSAGRRYEDAREEHQDPRESQRPGGGHQALNPRTSGLTNAADRRAHRFA